MKTIRKIYTLYKPLECKNKDFFFINLKVFMAHRQNDNMFTKMYINNTLCCINYFRQYIIKIIV